MGVFSLKVKYKMHNSVGCPSVHKRTLTYYLWTISEVTKNYNIYTLDDVL